MKKYHLAGYHAVKETCSDVITHEQWMENVIKLNEGQPSLMDLVNHQIESYEEEKRRSQIE